MDVQPILNLSVGLAAPNNDSRVTMNISTKCLKWSLMLWQMKENIVISQIFHVHIASQTQMIHFWLDKMPYAMMLCKILLFCQTKCHSKCSDRQIVDISMWIVFKWCILCAWWQVSVTRATTAAPVQTPAPRQTASPATSVPPASTVHLVATHQYPALMVW